MDFQFCMIQGGIEKVANNACKAFLYKDTIIFLQILNTVLSSQSNITISILKSSIIQQLAYVFILFWLIGIMFTFVVFDQTCLSLMLLEYSNAPISKQTFSFSSVSECIIYTVQFQVSPCIKACLQVCSYQHLKRTIVPPY